MSGPIFDPVAFEAQNERDMARRWAAMVDAAWDAAYSDVPASALESYADALAEENEVGDLLAVGRGYLDQLRSERAMQRYAEYCARPTSPEELGAAYERLAPLLAAPQCPSERLADPDLCDWTNPAPEALRRPSSAGNQQDGPDAVAPRPGRWRRLCRWISE